MGFWPIRAHVWSYRFYTLLTCISQLSTWILQHNQLEILCHTFQYGIILILLLTVIILLFQTIAKITLVLQSRNKCFFFCKLWMPILTNYFIEWLPQLTISHLTWLITGTNYLSFIHLFHLGSQEKTCYSCAIQQIWPGEV